MPELRCPNEHVFYYRNTRGSRSAGLPCPDCGEALRAPTAYLCNKLVRYEHVEDWSQVSWSNRNDVTRRVYRGRCTEPKGHDGGHAVRGRPALDD